ncbi:hypothetical protein [Rhodococcus sp. ACPA1]|uniref:hypothetical protein n=1 Tax=Rhodococcus sp. ACPA1 TaxID=2028572 RepID=UPI000BB0F329|nr:hypothetical protein [Rhodococcus sp. ACPA1]PBC51515.1 hypothetical protein CJ177_34025 [Rhodococcus sp. ACPA1]
MAPTTAERVTVECAGHTVLLADSVSFLSEADRGGAVVSASHGGVSAAEHALRFEPAVIAFNDAGGGKDDAGFAALEILQKRGIAALCVAHESARIGDAADHWTNGIISRANPFAAAHGVRDGMTVAEAFRCVLASAPRSEP